MMLSSLSLTSLQRALVLLVCARTREMTRLQTKKTEGKVAADVTTFVNIKNGKNRTVGQQMRLLLATDAVAVVGGHSEMM